MRVLRAAPEMEIIYLRTVQMMKIKDTSWPFLATLSLMIPNDKAAFAYTLILNTLCVGAES